MKKRTKIVLSYSAIALVAVVSLGMVSGEAAANGRMGMMFEKVDTNGDGFLDVAELKTAREGRFAAMDANKDGSVTPEEMTSHHMEMRAKHADHRGGSAQERFKKMDTDGNGSLSQAELEAGMSKRQARRAAAHQERIMAHLDVNKDGKLSPEEMSQKMPEKMLEHLDTDGDGRISKAEAGKMRGMRHHGFH